MRLRSQDPSARATADLPADGQGQLFKFLGSLLSAKDAPDLMETLSQTVDKLAAVKEAKETREQGKTIYTSEPSS